MLDRRNAVGRRGARYGHGHGRRGGAQVRHGWQQRGARAADVDLARDRLRGGQGTKGMCCLYADARARSPARRCPGTPAARPNRALRARTGTPRFSGHENGARGCCPGSAVASGDPGRGASPGERRYGQGRLSLDGRRAGIFEPPLRLARLCREHDPSVSSRPARLILLGDDATPELRRETSRDALVTPAAPPFFIWHTRRTSTSRRSTPTGLRGRSRSTKSRILVHVFAHGLHSLAGSRRRGCGDLDDVGVVSDR